MSTKNLTGFLPIRMSDFVIEPFQLQVQQLVLRVDILEKKRCPISNVTGSTALLRNLNLCLRFHVHPVQLGHPPFHHNTILRLLRSLLYLLLLFNGAQPYVEEGCLPKIRLSERGLLATGQGLCLRAASASPDHLHPVFLPTPPPLSCVLRALPVQCIVRKHQITEGSWVISRGTASHTALL